MYSVMLILCHSSLASEYKDDFESLSTRDAVSSGSSSDTITHVGSVSGDVSLKQETIRASPDADMQRGFVLSPIHDTQLSPMSDLGSTFGNSSLFTDAKPTEPQSPSKSPSHSKMATGSPYIKGDAKLLKGRSSKPSLLNTEQPPAPPTGSILPQEMTSSTESSVTTSSYAEQTQQIFASLAPISTDPSVKVSDSVHKVESITGGGLKSANVLKPLQVEKAFSKPGTGNSNRPPTSSVDKYDVPVLSSASTEGVEAGRKESSTGKLTSVSSPSVHHLNARSNDTVVDTLTVVTDIADSSLGGEGDGELSRVQSALVATEQPQIKSAQHKTETSSTRLQPTAKSIDGEFSTASEFSESSPRGSITEKPDLPERELNYEGLNIQELIRAITGEELASAGRDILEGSPRPEAPPEASTDKITQKFKRTGSAPGGSKVKRKPEQSGIMSKQKSHLSSSRDSLASNSSSLRKPTGAGAAHSRTKTRSSGKDNGTPVTGQESKRSRLPQKTTKLGNIGGEQAASKALPRPSPAINKPKKLSHKQTQEAHHLGPGSFPSHKEDFDHLSGLGGMAESVLPESPQRTNNSATMATAEETLRRKVCAC